MTWTVKCINCGRRRRCLLIQALVPSEDVDRERPNAPAFEVAESVYVCRSCLRDPLCPLAVHFARYAR